MRANQKLTKIIAGRVISSVAPGKNGKGEDVQMFTFGDGSIMSIKTPPGSTITAPANAKVLKVQQQDTALALNLGGGGSVAIQLAEVSSSVMLYDKAEKLEYAD